METATTNKNKGKGGFNRQDPNKRRGPKGRSFRKPAENRVEEPPEFTEKVVNIDRCAKVVKGGRRFSFSALVVIGDQKGRVGVGHGKTKEVPEAIRKATENAHKNIVSIQLRNNTIPHKIVAKSDGGCVLLKPASPGTGVIAGGGVRAVLEAVGIKDVLSKSLGSNTPRSMVNAALKALKSLRSLQQIKKIRSTIVETNE